MNDIDKIFVTKPLIPDLTELNETINDIFSSDKLTNIGLYHNKLENEIAEFLQVKHLSLVNNGTIGLNIALKALDLYEGEVITTPFTFPATTHSIIWNNLTPVFCDIDKDTMCIDANKIESLITSKTKAILAVHVYGYPCDVKKIQQIADKYNLKVIYDAAHAFSTKLDGYPISNFGDISVLSFHATKLFNTIEGGAIICNDQSIDTKIKLMRNFGIKNENEVLEIGINAKMNEIQAAIGTLNLKLVPEEMLKRDRLKKIYNESLSGLKNIIISNIPKNISDSYQYFVIRIIGGGENESNRNKVYDILRENNIYARKYFYPLCSEYPIYKKYISSRSENLSVAKSISEQVLCLPFYGNLKEDIIYKIVSLIKSATNE